MSETGYLKCSCKHCQGHIEFPAEAAGSEIACPHCGGETLLAAPAPTAGPIPVKVAAPKTAPVATTPNPVASPWDEVEEKAQRCGSCGAKLAAAAKACPNCGASTKPARGLSWFTIVGGIVVLGLLIALPFTVLRKGGSLRGGGKSGPDLVTAPHTLKKETGANLTYVVGTVVNNSDNRYLALKIEFDLLNAAGTSLGTTTDYLPILEPHKTWNYKAMVVDPDAVSAKFVNLSAERHIEDPKAIEERKAAEKKKADEAKKKKK